MWYGSRPIRGQTLVLFCAQGFANGVGLLESAGVSTGKERGCFVGGQEYRSVALLEGNLTG